MHSTTLGLDFGTTNTVVSLRRGEDIRTLTFDTRHGKLDTVRTVLALWQDPAKDQPSIAVGRDALAEFSQFPDDTRLIQSLKSYAANPLFRQAMILNRPHSFAQLMAEFLQQLFRLNAMNMTTADKIIVGRPVKFVGYQPDEKLALQRYREALSAVGFADVAFIHEPVAAALTFARRLQKSATVLIADFGGGTTDFSVLRLAAPGGNARHEVLGVGGIGNAGDQFDYRIVVNAVLPHLGMGTQYTSMGKTLDLPSHAFNSLARWNELSFLRSTKEYAELQELQRYAQVPDRLQRFFDIVDHSKGLALYDAVSALKRQLSERGDATLTFEGLDIGVTRQQFEGWISGDLARIEASLSATLNAIGCNESEIDSVFLTGGTSLVPAVRQIFARRFGAEKLHSGDELVSVAKGLSQASDDELLQS